MMNVCFSDTDVNMSSLQVSTFPDSASTCSFEPLMGIIEHVAAHIPHCLFELFHWLQTVRNSNKLKPHTFIWRFGSINRGAAASANQTHSEQRDPDMTPTIISKELLLSTTSNDDVCCFSDTDVNMSSLQVSTFPDSASTCSFEPLMEDH
ncbi:hypothetical protein QQF64_003087 [Cirrhinus molitorella]|uniref:Uncharacterized protein n=1 Tax=Cirrhinus molitorella TaxID=172907 RepID=A0ABR3MJZ6_9TELE